MIYIKIVVKIRDALYGVLELVLILFRNGLVLDWI